MKGEGSRQQDCCLIQSKYTQDGRRRDGKKQTKRRRSGDEKENKKGEKKKKNKEGKSTYSVWPRGVSEAHPTEVISHIFKQRDV